MLRCSTLALLPISNPSPKHAILNMKGRKRGHVGSSSMRLNTDHSPLWFSAPPEVWGKQQPCSTRDWPLYWRTREGSHTPMHQMAEVPTELLNPQSCVWDGAAIGDFHQPLTPFSWPSLSLKSEILTSPMYNLRIFYYWSWLIDFPLVYCSVYKCIDWLLRCSSVSWNNHIHSKAFVSCVQKSLVGTWLWGRPGWNVLQ